ncbi:MAG: aminoacyl-tRNA hydrolase [Dehalococcoidia bacterium]|nr:aminoacyl-tRNA hydrolase [Dehalococcoidia bacterium]
MGSAQVLPLSVLRRTSDLSHSSKQHRMSFKEKANRAEIAKGVVESCSIVLAKPQTSMNISGLSVSGLVRRYQVSPSDLLVVCDDLDLPLGKIRLRPGGSSGGHNGLQSIIDTLGYDNFPRLRMGIGRPEGYVTDNAVIDHVLGEFKPEELPVINDGVARAAEALFYILQKNLNAAMNKYNSG